MDSILVTGTGGFVGSKVAIGVAKAFPDRQIYALTRGKSLSNKILKNISNLNCDLLESDLEKTLPSCIHTILHFAANSKTFVPNEEFNNQFFKNLRMTSNLANFARSSKVECFGLASSVYIYSGLTSIPFKENNIEIPGEPLGASKIASEALLKMYSFSESFRSISFRIFTVYGPGSRHSQFIPQVIKKLQNKEHTLIFGSSEIKRDLIYIDDVVEGVVACLKNNKNFKLFESLNLGTGVSTPMGDVVKIISNLLGIRKKIRFDQTTLGKSDLNHCADINKINSLTGWKPKIDLKTGLKKTIKSY